MSEVTQLLERGVTGPLSPGKAVSLHPPPRCPWPGVGSGRFASSRWPCSSCLEPKTGSHAGFHQEPPALVSLVAAAASTATSPSWHNRPGFRKPPDLALTRPRS